MTERRIVSIWLPRLAIENWQRRNADWPEDLPLALATAGTHGQIVHDLNRAAMESGVSKMSRIVDMKTICPALKISDADHIGDTKWLARLALWARRWGPWSTPDGTDGLLIDTSGADHLFGGEPAMLIDIQDRFASAGCSTRLAIAPTRGAAWGLARFGSERAISKTDPLPYVAPLPVAALRLDPQTLLLLRRLGIRTISDLVAVPRLALMRRFGRANLAENPLLRLDQMLGRRPEPMASPEPPPRYLVETRLADPVMDPSDWLPGMIKDLCDQLAAQAQGCRQLRLSIFRVDGVGCDVTARTAAPTREAGHLLRLFDGKLENIDPGFGFDVFRLTAEAVEPLNAAQPGLDGEDTEGLALARLIDRLTARFGADAISRPLSYESHIPERSQILGAPVSDAPAPLARADRPLRLLTPPEEIRVLYAIPEGPPGAFIWRHQTLRVAKHAGPERIAPEWWHDRSGTRLRDYFRIEDPTGLRLWIYREGLIHDGRGAAPRWFLHGIFA
ncbi:DNA polymerase Y family protein [Paracoccus aestuariivivens]|uniref:DNA polymerase Y family protein n=1 Tax=Paracoccus aestuariivivens TaxID=1820333 RepID=A0A6L6JEI2_9RHOB|nr:DNA polymerase Y family protein [Paracoccus aestuariivivens]MTH78574.1 DNA polymerase Y family protein [Paracoccus aestuariivivens]